MWTSPEREVGEFILFDFHFLKEIIRIPYCLRLFLIAKKKKLFAFCYPMQQETWG